ncbi:hypothetical protein IAU60_006425 [Kwoniella sp. DSM 27419]
MARTISWEMRAPSSDESSEDEPVHVPSQQNPGSPDPDRYIPRLDHFSTPLRSSKRVEAVNNPVRRLDLSQTTLRTPRRKLDGLVVLSRTPGAVTAESTSALPGPQPVTPVIGLEAQTDDLDGLNLGALVIADETGLEICPRVEESHNGVVEEDDVDYLLAPDNKTSSADESHVRDVYGAPSMPIEVLSDSASESAPGAIRDPDEQSDIDSVQFTPAPRRAPGRRRVVVSDSESEAESSRPVSAEHAATPLAGPSRRPKPAALRYIEDQAFASDGSEAEYEEDSLGSLRDFIVDDDESEMSASEGDGSESEDSDGIEVLDTPPRGVNTRPKPTQKPSSRPTTHGTLSDGDEGILHHSPTKKLHRLVLPDLGSLNIISSDSETEPRVTPARTTKTRGVRRRPEPSTKSSFSAKAWAEERVRISQTIFDDLDVRVFEGKLGVGAGGAGARIEWNKRLLTTAGVARSKRIINNGESRKDFWIELSEKVLTGEEQILNTVAHEMCHLATWIISGDYKNPHGSVFKSWGRKVMRARKDVEVTTKHSYVIEYKYEWKCSSTYCGKVYKRHSKSIDPAKHACGSCKGKLVPLFAHKQKAASAFQLYLKANMKLAKAAMPGQPHGEVMRALSKRWNEVGEQGDNERYWVELARGV